MTQFFNWRKVSPIWFLALLPVAASAQPVVWVAPSLQRTGQNDAAGNGTQAHIYAAKGEYESFQIVVRAPSGGLTNVNVTVSDLTGPGGAIIPKSSFSLFREQYVYVNQSSPTWSGTNQPLGAGWYPDGLIPFNDPSTGLPITSATLKAVPFSLSASTNQPVWVDLLVPRTATAGQYNGTFTVTSAQGSTSGTIVATVWNFTLPMKSNLRSAFLYWTADSLGAEQELLRNRITPLVTSPANQSGLMSGYGLSTVDLDYFSGADVSTCTMSAAPSIATFQTAAAAQQSGLFLYNYTADEVGNCSNLYTTLKQWAYNMHQAGVDNLVTMSPDANLYDDGSGTGRSAVDIWVMLPIMYDQHTSGVSQVLTKGDLAWSYNTLVQDSYSPKWTIDFAPVNFRIQPGFISQSLGLTGMLYWRIDRWSSDPWNQVNNQGAFSSNNYPGEGALVYPGSTVGITGVAPSMRLKWLRDGVDDYDYIALLKAAGQGTLAMQIAKSVGSDWTNWTRDINALENARIQAGQALDQASGGSGGGTGGGTGGTGGGTGGTGNVAPVAVSVSPVASTGKNVTLTLTSSDANGAADIAGAGAMINSSVSGSSACWFYYDRASNSLSLADDAGAAWKTLSSGGTVGNSQCTIRNVSATPSGNSFTLKVGISFANGFTGTKNVYEYVQDNEGLNSGYQPVGTWTR